MCGENFRLPFAEQLGNRGAKTCPAQIEMSGIAQVEMSAF
jgi:hypothetical protein